MNMTTPVECRCCGTTITAHYCGVSGIESRDCGECGYSLEWSEEGYVIRETIPEKYQGTVAPTTFDEEEGAES